MESIESTGVIRNRVAESGIQVLNLEDFLPAKPVSQIDLASFLDGGFILREKPFRVAIKETDWSQYAGHHVGIFCSTDAIIPTWAYVLVASSLDSIAASVDSGSSAVTAERLLLNAIDGADFSAYTDLIVVIKGCGSDAVTPAAYVKATTKLQQVAKKLMYGEPCSSVPIWRRPAGQ